MFINDHQITIREFADEVGISICSFSNILGMRRMLAKFVPKLTTNFEVNVDSDLLERVRTGDKIRLYELDVETKAHTEKSTISAVERQCYSYLILIV